MTTRLSLSLIVLLIMTLAFVPGASTNTLTSVRTIKPQLFLDTASGRTEAEILKLYYEMSALTLEERKAAFRNASADDKSDLWRTHLALVLVKRPELNKEQQEIIKAAVSLATPRLFDIVNTDAAWKSAVRDPLRSLEKQIADAFSSEDAAKIFATLSADEPLGTAGPYHHLMYSRLDWQEKNKDKEKEKNEDKKKDERKPEGPAMILDRPLCTCSIESDYCISYLICSSSNCSETKEGCGTLWRYPCDGTCR